LHHPIVLEQPALAEFNHKYSIREKVSFKGPPLSLQLRKKSVEARKNNISIVEDNAAVRSHDLQTKAGVPVRSDRRMLCIDETKVGFRARAFSI
jgi:hypothetical protein